MKIDRRISYKIVIDTETCPVDKDIKDVDPTNMWTYDIGWAVVDKRGTVYAQRSFIVRDIFFGEASLMKSAYYANKIPMYLEDIGNGSRVVESWFNIRQQLVKDIELYGVEEIYAYNARFDRGTVNTTQKWLTKSKFRGFFPSSTTICDIMKMAQDVVGKMPTYRTFCEENGFFTKTGRLSMTAENVYRFIINDPTFVESHTGLEDVMIEKEIMAYCYKQHKAMRKKLYENELPPYVDPFEWVRPVL